MAVTPRVSVITATKNRLKLLCETIDSVQAQTFENWEHIVVDDGSNDGTGEELARRTASDPRIRYVRRESEKSGANVCRNIGIKESAAEFIVILDSDDLLGRDCLGRRVEKMERNLDLDFATFQGGVFENKIGDLREDFDPELVGDDLLRFLFFECPWVITGPIWRKTSMVSLGAFYESLPSWQDIDLHVRAITQGYRYLRFRDVDHYVRWQDEPTRVSVEQRRSPRHLEAASSILNKLEHHVREGPGMTWTRQRALCSLYFFVAQQWLATQKLSSALRSWNGIRRRELGSNLLYFSGAALLVISALNLPDRGLSDRLVNKWKGWMRLRTNPQLIHA
jgi:glycosyltransferase involved in cell wall biosynthesis